MGILFVNMVTAHKEVQLASIITCPACGHRAEEQMPTDACIYFYECKGCRTLLRPLPGHCCVFCSFGDCQVSTGAARTGVLCVG